MWNSYPSYQILFLIFNKSFSCMVLMKYFHAWSILISHKKKLMRTDRTAFLRRNEPSKNIIRLFRFSLPNVPDVYFPQSGCQKNAVQLRLRVIRAIHGGVAERIIRVAMHFTSTWQICHSRRNLHSFPNFRFSPFGAKVFVKNFRDGKELRRLQTAEMFDENFEKIGWKIGKQSSVSSETISMYPLLPHWSLLTLWTSEMQMLFGAK